MIIYEKTPKGLDEVKSKAHGLSMIERRVLIFVDGKRTLDAISALPRVDDPDNIIGFLETEGFITPAATAAPPAAESSRPEVPDTPFRELPATFQPEKFNMAKNYMTNTLNHFKGFYGATRLVREIDECRTHEELRALYDAWCREIDGTRQSKKRGDQLRKDLLDVL